MRRPLAVLGALAGLLAVATAATLWATRPRLTDEALIDRSLLEIKRGIEAHEAGVILRQIADAYHDGVHSKRDLVGMVLEGCRNPEEYRVTLEPPEVRIVGKAAHVRLNATFSAGNGAGGLSEPVAMALVIDMARTRRGWQVTSARGWEPAVQADL